MMYSCKKLFFLYLLFIVGFANAQFAGTKSKEPYLGIDGYTYKIGDKIKIAFATKGNDFQSIYIYKHESALETGSKFLDVLTSPGTRVTDNPVNNATKEINEFQGNILFFRKVKLKESGIVTFAILKYKDAYRLAVPIDLAISVKEMISSNPEYQVKQLENTTADFSNEGEMIIKSFSSNFNVKYLSAIGDENNQTVTVNFLISHKLVHQDICIGSIDYRERTNSVYDFSGNEYVAKTFFVGNKQNTFLACNKIPTNVPVKVSVEFKQVLPTVKELSYLDVAIGYRSFDSSDSYKKSNLEINNIKIDWQ